MHAAETKRGAWAKNAILLSRNQPVSADQLDRGTIQLPATVGLLGPSGSGKTTTVAAWALDGTFVNEDGQPVTIDHVVIFATRISGNEVYNSLQLALLRKNPNLTFQVYAELTEEKLFTEAKRRPGFTLQIIDDFMEDAGAMKLLNVLTCGRWREQPKTVTCYTLQVFFNKNCMKIRNNSTVIVVFPMRNDRHSENQILHRLTNSTRLAELLLQILHTEPTVGNKIICTNEKFYNRHFLPISNLQHSSTSAVDDG